MSTDWTQFPSMNGFNQAKFLFYLAKKSLPFINFDKKYKSKMTRYVILIEPVLNGDLKEFNELMKLFQNDGEEDDFNDFFFAWDLSENKCEKEFAAYEIVTYACGFALRHMAKEMKLGAVTDPVEQADPIFYEHYQKQTEFLGI